MALKLLHLNLHGLIRSRDLELGRDADTGGQKEHLVFTIRTLERLGISAAVIEDKTGLKKNSLFENITRKQTKFG